MSNAAEPVGNKETAETAHLEGASALPDGKDILVDYTDIRHPSSSHSSRVSSGPKVFKPKPVTDRQIAGARAQLVTDNQFLIALRTQRKVHLDEILVQEGHVSTLDAKVENWERWVLEERGEGSGVSCQAEMPSGVRC